MSLGRRWSANAGGLALLGLLCLAATLLVAAAPRLANQYTDEGLREWIESRSYTARDLSYVLSYDGTAPPGVVDEVLGDLRSSMAAPLRDRLGAAWYATQAGGVATGPDLARRGAEVGVSQFILSLRDQSGAADAVRLVAGRWPRNPRLVTDRVEAAVSASVARALGLRAGSAVDITGAARVSARAAVPVLVRIVGVFEPLDRDAPIWAEEPYVLQPIAPVGEDPPKPWIGVLLTDAAGMSHAMPQLGGIRITWRFRLDESRVTAADLPVLTEAVLDARSQDVVPAATAMITLDSTLADFARGEASARALVAVVQAGVVATLLGLVVLAALAATRRRHGELALLRSRGASLPRVAARLLVESGPVVALAVGLGYALSALVPGRPGGLGWLAVAFGLAAAVTAPALAMAAHRRVSVALAADQLARPRVSPRRVTAELTLIAVAVAGVLLLRRRGLAAGFRSPGPTGSDVDIYLALLPALVAAAAALLALRLLPYPLRLLTAAAARARGAVAFLGLARAGRATSTSAAPVVVLVIAVSTGTFCAAVAGSVSAARAQVAELAVPGDAIVVGDWFPPATAAELAAAPGVTAVASIAIERNQPLVDGRSERALTRVTAVVVDAAALDRVLRAAGRSQSVPSPLVTATRGDGFVPAVVSPDVASALGGAGAPGGILVQDRLLQFTVADVTAGFPGLGGVTRFVALPWSALAPADAEWLEPTTFALAGANLDVDATREIGEAARLAAISPGLRDVGLPSPTRALTYERARDDLERAGVDRVLDLTLAVGLGAGLVLALLAVGYAVATGSQSRGQALSRLRTMGLEPGQGRRLLIWELLPLILLGAFVGSAVGTALPVLLGPALGLSAFSDGGAVVFAPDPTLPGIAFSLVLLAVLVATVAEASMNRRARLGAVLRVGRES